MAEDEGEQPHHPLGSRFVGEGGTEVGEIDLGLAARRGLEPALEGGTGGGPDAAEVVLHGRVAAFVPAFADLAQQPLGGQFRHGLDALPQIVLPGRDDGLPGRPGRVDRRLQTTLDACADRLAVQPGPPGNGRQAQALPMKIKDHDYVPKCDHRALRPFCR